MKSFLNLSHLFGSKHFLKIEEVIVQQKIILSEFKKVFGNQSYRSISKITGIQNTRVFRIFNGSEMRIGEAEIFLDLISKKNTEEFSKVFYQVYLPNVFEGPKKTKTRFQLKQNLINRIGERI